MAQLGEWLNSVLKWKCREMPLLRILQGLWVSLDNALERMLSECMDKASDFPDPRDVEVSVEAVHCTVEENVMKDTVSEFPVREKQFVREVDGWPEYEEEIVCKNTFLQTASVSLKCQCLVFVKRRER